MSEENFTGSSLKNNMTNGKFLKKGFLTLFAQSLPFMLIILTAIAGIAYFSQRHRSQKCASPYCYIKKFHPYNQCLAVSMIEARNNNQRITIQEARQICFELLHSPHCHKTSGFENNSENNK